MVFLAVYLIIYAYVLFQWISGISTNPVQPILSMLILQLKYSLFQIPDSENKDFLVPSKTRVVTLIRVCIALLWIPINTLLWSIDELLYPRYHAADLSGSVFVVGSYRTGSTTLHRLLHLDERFTSPKFLELFMPFIWFHKLLIFLGGILPSSFVKDFKQKSEKAFFKKLFGDDVSSRHPMSWTEAEEDDILIAAWHRAGWYAGLFFPHPDVWMKMGRILNLPKHEQNVITKLYTLTMKKVLYRRPGIFLTKTHLIDLMPLLEKCIPNAHFLSLNRHPKSAFPSWYGLYQATCLQLTQSKLPLPVAVNAHYRFWDYFAASQMAFFRGSIDIDDPPKKDDKVPKIILTFGQFIKDPFSTVSKLYAHWGFTLDTTFEQKIKGELSVMRAYKTTVKHKNLSLKDLGIKEEYLDERYREYIKVFNM